MKINTFLSALVALCMLFSFTSQAQNTTTGSVASAQADKKPAYKVALFEKVADRPDYRDIVTESVSLRLDYEKLNEVFTAHPTTILFEIPTADGSVVQVAAEEHQIFAEGFKVTTSDGKDFDYTPGIYYSGKVVGHEDHCFASISIFNNEVMAVVSFGDDNYNLGPTGHEAGENYVFYKDADMIDKPKFECGVDDYAMEPDHDHPAADNRSPSCHRVKMYIEADYELYQLFGSNTATTANYVTAIFASLSTLYQVIGVQMHISKLYVYTGPDPYFDENGSAFPTTAKADFENLMQVTGYDGDIAHLFSADNSGGLANIGGLCGTDAQGCAVSCGLGNGATNFPAYSWSVNVITHETGHLMSSRHTHACVWGPNHNTALDNCSATEGGCAPGPTPANGGTLMSYCHLVAGVGMNFANGFGAEPGSKISTYVNNAGCLSCNQSGTLDIIAVTPIFCGANTIYNTVNGSGSTTTYANVSSYNGCPWNESGPERIFSFNIVNPTEVAIQITQMQSELDIFLLSSLNPSACFYWDDDHITTTLQPGTYYLVVDGRNGALGAFNLSFNCAGYCQASGYNNSNIYINSIGLNSITSITGNNHGYYLNPALIGQIQRGPNQAYFLLEAGFTSNTMPIYCRVFIDLNGDNDFDDTDESVFNTANPSTNGLAGGYLSIPASAPHSITRMRVIAGQSPLIACNTFFNGEVEDYYVEILPFCPAQGNTVDEYIQEITVGNLHQVSGNNFGYTDYTNDNFWTRRQIPKGQNVPVSLIAGFTNTPYYENFRIWVDANGNGDFEAGEQVFEGVAQGSSPVTGNLFIPANTPSGYTGMRISMKYGAMPDGCPNGSYMGETEDYIINIVPFCPSEMIRWDANINKVILGSLNNTSAYQENNGYKDYTYLSPPQLAAGSNVDFSLEGYSGYNSEWGIWLDTNLDKSFTADEKVYSGSGNNQYSAFLVPSGLPNNTIVPMRITVKENGTPVGCFTATDPNFYDTRRGETEDYLVQITCADNTWYYDYDEDGYGRNDITQTGCQQPTGYVAANDDCNDQVTAIHPNAQEICNSNIDDDCDGLADNADPSLSSPTFYYRDYDQDSYGGIFFIPGCELGPGFSLVNTDCRDSVSTIYPGATELCNGIDDNCDNLVDNGIACPKPTGTASSMITANSALISWTNLPCANSYEYRYRSQINASTWSAWSAWVNVITNNTNLSSLAPNTTYQWVVRSKCGNATSTASAAASFTTCTVYTFYRDLDGDGYGNAAMSYTQSCSTVPIAGYVSNNTDCNDNSNTVYPGAPELCDGIDNDCDMLIAGDEGSTWYRNIDGDNYGNPAVTTLSCAQPVGYIAVSGDCNDNVATIYPGAPELCNGLDDNCDNLVDNGVACPKPTGTATSNITANAATISWTSLPCATGYQYKYRYQLAGGTWSAYTAWVIVNTNTANLSNLSQNTTYQWVVQSRCGTATSTASASNTFTTCSPNTFYQDSDGDGYGNPGGATSQGCSNVPPAGYVSNNTDCNDANNAIHPGAPELCDGIDNDCDMLIIGDEGVVWYRNVDGDNYGTAAVTTISCTQPVGYTALAGDCNDNSAAIQPGATELCNSIDDNCDNIVDNVASCPSPTGLNATNILSTSATINWNAIPCAVNGFKYRIRYLIGPGNIYSAWGGLLSTPTNSANLTNLLPGRLYEYQVYTACYGTLKSATVTGSFTTLAAALVSAGIETPEGTLVTTEKMVHHAAIFPNPVKETFSIRLDGLQVKDATMLNIDGRVIQSLAPEMLENEIDISALQTGTYMMQLITEDGEVVVLRFVKM